MLAARGYATASPESSFEPFSFERRQVGAKDVLIEILFSGICHSDIHQARNEWGNSIYPMVPGHEIVGRVVETGAEVTKFKDGRHRGRRLFRRFVPRPAQAAKPVLNNVVWCIARRPTTRPKWIKKRRPTADIQTKSWWTKLTR